ncbi:autotransporter, putative [Fulvimarina pelagi HTCC2506]|uniref:Autotransporter, putative n=1 Tax=Fulvimarina pelagi HTCC2506 TaxID=314231 RepID=Q0G2V6_9HYPH|nr:autotransporter, putative [Fulvimarina pelagi HTCC2506]
MGSSIVNSGTIRETSGAGDAILFDYGEDDRLELQPGSIIEGFVRAGAGTDTLAFGGNSGTFNFDISSVDGNNRDDGEQYLDFENFEKVGAATTNLTGTNTEITDFAVNGGLLNVNGSMPNTAFAVNGGVLGGDGTVGSFVANSGGTIAPGNSIGTLNVAGNATFQSGSVYEVEIAADGTGDQVRADTATINGGTVDVVTLDPYTAYTDGQRYTIVSTANGRTGTFDSLQDDSAFLDYNLLYTSNDVILELIRALQFPDVARTFNQRQTANALMQLDQTPGSASNGLYNALLLLDAPTARDAFDQLSGEPHASMKTALIQDSRFVRDAAQIGSTEPSA